MSAVEQPERAEQEGALVPRQAIGSAVAVDVPVVAQVALDDIDRGQDPRVGRRQEPERGDEQGGGIGQLVTGGLHEPAVGRALG